MSAPSVLPRVPAAGRAPIGGRASATSTPRAARPVEFEIPGTGVPTAAGNGTRRGISNATTVANEADGADAGGNVGGAIQNTVATSTTSTSIGVSTSSAATGGVETGQSSSTAAATSTSASTHTTVATTNTSTSTSTSSNVAPLAQYGLSKNTMIVTGVVSASLLLVLIGILAVFNRRRRQKRKRIQQILGHLSVDFGVIELINDSREKHIIHQVVPDRNKRATSTWELASIIARSFINNHQK